MVLVTSKPSGEKCSSIRETIRSKLFSLISNVQADFKIVIVDERTIKMLDSICSMHEILDGGVYLIEAIGKSRQPYPNMEAIYIIEPSLACIERVIQDFTSPTLKLKSGRTGPAYAAAHLFFTEPIPSPLFQQLASSPAAPYIKSLLETYIDFIPFESRAFIVGSEGEEIKIYKLLLSSLPGRMPSGPELASLEYIASRIVSVCVSMSEIPIVRYSSPGSLSSRLAVLVQEGLDRYVSINPSFRSGGKQGQLLLLDRNFDLLAPLLHEFSYQAMANDLLSIANGSKYSYRFTTPSGESTRTVTLDEADSLWNAIRHVHIADCSNLIIEKFNQFVSENKAAMKSASSSKPVQTSENVTSLADLRETMNALSEFHEMKGQYSLHLSVAQDCLAVFERKKLMEVAIVEQDMVTGQSAEGDVPKDLWNRLASLLGRSSLDSLDRARLVLLYLLTQPKLSDVDRSSLLDHAKLESAHVESIRQILNLSGANSKDYQPMGQRKSGKKSKRRSPLDDPPSYDVSRYTPALKIILDDANFEELDSAQFPMAKNTGPNIEMRGAAPTSLRAKLSTITSSNATSSPSGGPIFAFILGGITYSEIRSAYELSNLHKRDFYVGGDCILTPEKFLSICASR